MLNICLLPYRVINFIGDSCVNSFLELRGSPKSGFQFQSEEKKPFYQKVVGYYETFRNNVELETNATIDKMYSNYISKP